MDFKNLNGVWKLKRFCITCIQLILNFCLSKFFFSLNLFFFFNFDFQMHKTYLKSLIFEILVIGDYNSTFYLFDGKV